MLGDPDEARGRHDAERHDGHDYQRHAKAKIFIVSSSRCLTPCSAAGERNRCDGGAAAAKARPSAPTFRWAVPQESRRRRLALARTVGQVTRSRRHATAPNPGSGIAFCFVAARKRASIWPAVRDDDARDPSRPRSRECERIGRPKGLGLGAVHTGKEQRAHGGEGW